MQPVPEPLFLALDFYHDPRRFEQLRQPHGSLPPGMGELLAAPGGCLSDEQVEATAQVLGDTPENCREAVLFFIKQVMFEVPGDHYRVLGVNRDAEPAQIKEHYFHLMRLFHPDRDTEGDGWDDVYAPRINEAYNVLRNAGKRAAYDAQLAPPAPPEQQPVGAATAAMSSTPPAASAPVPPSNPVGAATAAMHSPPTPAPTTTALWRKPWLYAALVVFLVGLLFVVLFQSSQAPRLTVAAVATADGPDTGGGEQEAGEELAVAAAAAETGFDAAPAGSSGTVYGSPESDAEIEARVQARVAQATRAVLGAPRQIAAVAAPTETVADAEPQPDAAPDPVGAATAAKNPAQEIAVDVGQGQIAAVAAPTETVAAAVPEPDAAPDTVGAATAAIEPAAAPAPAPITDAELDDLLLAFTYHYEFRDAAAFAALFAPDARTTDASGRTNIRDLYAGFFADNEVQGVRFSKVRWRSGELLRSGSARVHITTAPIAGGDASTVEAQIRFDVGRADSGDLLITRMTY